MAELLAALLLAATCLLPVHRPGPDDRLAASEAQGQSTRPLNTPEDGP